MLAPKKEGEDQAIRRSKGGLSTKIHALVDALGNPIALFLTQGQAHDLRRRCAAAADASHYAVGDKAFDADERVIQPLLAAGKTPVIPPKSNRKIQRTLEQFRAIATRYDKTARNFLAGIHLAAATILPN